MFELAEPYIDVWPWVLLAWGSVLVIALAAWSQWSRGRKLSVFGVDKSRSAEWLDALRARRWIRASLVALAILFFTAAALQPRANPQRQTYKITARDIVVILDASRSMLADDLQPNRLERAKLELARLADRLEGDRIGLVVFAGNASIKCPLTSDYSYFKRVLRDVTATSASVGGTRIGDAIWKGLGDLLGLSVSGGSRDAAPKAGETVLEEESRGEKQIWADLLIITDGEDHGGHALDAARSAAALNVGIYAVGLGSEEGTPIPLVSKGGRELLKDRQGNVVLSKLDSRGLQDMVNAAPRGRYLPVGTHNFDLVDFFDKTIAKESGRELVDEQVMWTEIFQPFLIAGLVLYLIYLVLPERPRRGRLASAEVAT